jgi:hypothetical protein
MPPPPNASPAPIPPAPAPPAYGIAALFAFRDVKRRWPFAWRAALCMGLPVLIGWAAGDTEAGLMATIGTFTATARAVLPYVARGAAISTNARMARRDLQHRTLALAETYEARVGASAAQRRAAEVHWPAVVAIQRLAYRTLSACWALERLGGEAAREAANAMVGPSGAAEIDRTLGDLTTAIRDGRTPIPPADLPGFLGAEVTTVCESLVRDARPL